MKNVYKILIVDDEYNNRELIINLLNKHFNLKFTLYEAVNFFEFKKITSENNLDIIFTDSKIPFKNESHFFTQISNKKTQIVLCTALGIEQFTNLDQKPIYFLQKPINIEDFKTICQIIINHIDAFENALII